MKTRPSFFADTSAAQAAIPTLPDDVIGSILKLTDPSVTNRVTLTDRGMHAKNKEIFKKRYEIDFGPLPFPDDVVEQYIAAHIFQKAQRAFDGRRDLAYIYYKQLRDFLLPRDMKPWTTYYTAVVCCDGLSRPQEVGFGFSLLLQVLREDGDYRIPLQIAAYVYEAQNIDKHAWAIFKKELVDSGYWHQPQLKIILSMLQNIYKNNIGKTSAANRNLAGQAARLTSYFYAQGLVTTNMKIQEANEFNNTQADDWYKKAIAAGDIRAIWLKEPQAEKSYIAGDTEKLRHLLPYFQSILADHPPLPGPLQAELNYIIGRIHFIDSSNNADAAIEAFNKVIELAPQQHYDIYNLLGRSYQFRAHNRTGFVNGMYGPSPPEAIESFAKHETSNPHIKKYSTMTSEQPLDVQLNICIAGSMGIGKQLADDADFDSLGYEGEIISMWCRYAYSFHLKADGNLHSTQEWLAGFKRFKNDPFALCALGVAELIFSYTETIDVAATKKHFENAIAINRFALNDYLSVGLEKGFLCNESAAFLRREIEGLIKKPIPVPSAAPTCHIL